MEDAIVQLKTEQAHVGTSSRELSIAITALETAVLWLAEDRRRKALVAEVIARELDG